MAGLSGIDLPRPDADLVRAYLDRLAVLGSSTEDQVTEPGAPLRRHSGRSGEDVWSL